MKHLFNILQTPIIKVVRFYRDLRTEVFVVEVGEDVGQVLKKAAAHKSWIKNRTIVKISAGVHQVTNPIVVSKSTTIRGEIPDELQ